MKLEEILILTIATIGLATAILVIWILGNLTNEFNVPKQKVDAKKQNKIVSYISNNLIKILTLFSYSIILYVLIRSNYIKEKSIELESLIRVSSVLLTIFIGYLFAKLFQLRKEKIEDQKIIAEYSEKLTGYRRFLYYILATDAFWKKKNEISIARHRHPKINYRVLEVEIYELYDEKQEFYNDKSFSSLRVLLYYMMEELMNQRYQGWRFDLKAEIVYPKPVLEWYDHAINQLWYYFDYKYAKHTIGTVDDVILNHSYYTKDMLSQLAKLDSKYNATTTIDHLTIGEQSGNIKTDVLEKMIELTKYNSEYISPNMKMVTNLMLVILITGLLIPMLSQFISSNLLVINILGFISILGIGFCILWLMFELKTMILEELNTA